MRCIRTISSDLKICLKTIPSIYKKSYTPGQQSNPMNTTPAADRHPQNARPTAEVAVVSVPLAAQGHLNQLFHLSRLISRRGIPVHFITTAMHSRQARTRAHGWDPAVATAPLNFHEVHLPPFENPPPNPNSILKAPTQIVPMLQSYKLTLRRPVYELVLKLSSNYRRVVVIYDSTMLYSVQDIESIQNTESYCFQCTAAFTVYSIYWDFAGRSDLPAGAEMIKECPSIMEGCLAPEFSELSKLDIGVKKLNSADIYNTSRVMEGFYLDLLAEEKTSGADKLWALGPFHLDPNLTRKTSGPNKCLDWLDKQRTNSVILVSFGTTASSSDEEITEIAVGLERSEQKFIWVLRDADKGDIFTGEVRRAELPEGFEERVAGRGLIVRDWAPQTAILGHSSTGGFMSHCGWNSTLESMSLGVPMATWPMHSDQPKNAFFITKMLRIGVEVKDWGRWKDVVPASKVENGVRRLMDSAEGEELRKRAAEIGRTLRDSVMESGDSRVEMDQFIEHITR